MFTMLRPFRAFHQVIIVHLIRISDDLQIAQDLEPVILIQKLIRKGLADITKDLIAISIRPEIIFLQPLTEDLAIHRFHITQFIWLADLYILPQFFADPGLAFLKSHIHKIDIGCFFPFLQGMIVRENIEIDRFVCLAGCHKPINITRPMPFAVQKICDRIRHTVHYFTPQIQYSYSYRSDSVILS